MPLFAACAMLFLSFSSLLQQVVLEAPNPRVVQRLEWAKDGLERPLLCVDAASCDDVAINALALTALGRFDLARPALAAAQHRTPLWLVAVHQYWLASADDAFLHKEWWSIENLLYTAPSLRWVNDGGVLLAAVDGLLSMARALSDSIAIERARSVYALAEQRAQEFPGVIAPAFGLLNAELADAHINRLADTVHARWPLATGLLATGLYEYHRDTAAFSLVQGMAENQSSTAAMFVLPLLRGLLGWEVDARHRAAALEPHLPASWNALTVSNLPLGHEKLTLSISRGGGMYSLRFTRRDDGAPVTLHLAPGFQRGTRIESVKVNEKDVPVHTETSAHDVHVVIETTLRREATIEIEYVPVRRTSPR